MNIAQHFLLVTCPNYTRTCEKDKTYSSEIVNCILTHYNELFDEFLSDIKQWIISDMLCLVNLIKFILEIIHSLSYEQRKSIYEIILTIFSNKSTIDSSTEEV